MLVFSGVGLLDKKESWWFSFQPLRKIRCVKHGNLPKRGAVEHQMNEKATNALFLYYEKLSCPDGSQMTPIKNCSTSLSMNLEERGPKKLEMTTTVANGIYTAEVQLISPLKSNLASKGSRLVFHSNHPFQG